MRTCANCGKSNLPTRKFCIRCGRSLISSKVSTSKATKEKVEVPEVGRTITGKDVHEEPPQPVDTEEEWVKPSQISTDRIRSTETRHQTEMEKAKAAFARAEEVGLDEDDTGVVETRMLRASEVKELMEGLTEMTGSESEDEGDDLVPGPPPIAAPSPEDLETQILGSMSAYVEPTVTEEITEEPFTDEFSSAKYGSAVISEEAPELTVSTPEHPIPKTVDLGPVDDSDTVSVCPNCGELVNIDSFEYPLEIYSAMGTARMKQARFFVVQGKYDEAQKIVRIARSLFMKSNDKAGLAEVGKLVDSLARRG